MSANESDPSPSRSERLSKFASVLGALLLLFLLAGIVAHAHPGYSRFLEQALQALRANHEFRAAAARKYPVTLWYFETSRERGLVQLDPGYSSEGLTLCLTGEGGIATLIDNIGREVHRWDVPFSHVWPKPAHTSAIPPNHCAHVRRGHVFPNGDLLALYESPVVTPYGCGLAKVNRSGDVLWTFDANAHHDFSVAEDGRIFALTHEIRQEPHPLWERVPTPMIEEFLVELSPNGEVLRRWSLFDVVAESPFYRPDTVNALYNGDVLHSNTVNQVGAEFASHYEEIQAGDVMLCFRNANLVAVFNPDSSRIVWGTTGPWLFPHDPDPLPNGNILIFDNSYASGTHDGSRVVEFDPRGNGAVAWQYVGTDQDPFRSTIRSVQQLLPNDNVLITSSDQGRIFEVTRDGRIVWDYFNPARDGDNGKLVSIYCGGRRYERRDLPFLNEPEVANHSTTAARD